MLTIMKRSNEFSDELAWAASWLYRATGNSSYRIDAETFYNEYDLLGTADFSWDAKISGADVSTVRNDEYIVN